MTLALEATQGLSAKPQSLGLLGADQATLGAHLLAQLVRGILP